MREIELRLTVDEVNLVLEALGQMPFARVYPLVGKLQEQAGRQVGNGENQPESVLDHLPAKVVDGD